MKKIFLFVLCMAVFPILFSCNQNGRNDGNGGLEEGDGNAVGVLLPESLNNFEYTVKADGNAVITGLTDAGKVADELEIPGKWETGVLGKGVCIVDEIGEGAFANAGNMKKMTVPSSVKKIGKRAFENCTAMHAVILPDCLEVLEEGIFSGCSALCDFSIPESVKEIGSGAFAGCDKIDGITLFKGVEYHEDSFDDSVVIKVITNPKDIYIYERKHGTIFLKGIKDGFKDEEFFEIPKKIEGKDVGALEGTFYQNTKVKKVVMRNNIQFIHMDTFNGCTSLEEVVLPDRFDSPEDKFYGYFYSLEGQTFANCTSLKSITIPEGLEVLNVNAFMNCSSLKEVHLPSTLKTITCYVFSGCSSLEHIDFPEGLEEIWNAAFLDCSSLKEAILPKNLKSLGGAFQGCTSMTKVVMPENSDDGRLASCLFDHCVSLEDITLPKNVKHIDRRAFYGCKNLAFEIPSTVETIGCNAFYGCEKMKNAVLPHGLESIGCTSFWGCGSGNCAMLEAVFFARGFNYGVDENFLPDDLTFDGTADEWEKVSGHEHYTGMSFSR